MNDIQLIGVEDRFIYHFGLIDLVMDVLVQEYLNFGLEVLVVLMVLV